MKETLNSNQTNISKANCIRERSVIWSEKWKIETWVKKWEQWKRRNGIIELEKGHVRVSVKFFFPFATVWTNLAEKEIKWHKISENCMSAFNWKSKWKNIWAIYIAFWTIVNKFCDFPIDTATKMELLDCVIIFGINFLSMLAYRLIVIEFITKKNKNSKKSNQRKFRRNTPANRVPIVRDRVNVDQIYARERNLPVNQ